MVAGVVTLGRNRYVVGLYWENSPGSGRVAQIAREAANQAGQRADFYAVRPGNNKGRIPQFGLTGSEVGQKPNMPVLAACLASQVPGSWVGAFRVNEGIVLFIVRDDLIVPDGDLYFLDETEARDRLIQEVGFGGLQSIYAPESWSIPSADTIPLALLLNDNKDIKLQQVRLPKKFKIIAITCALLFFIVAGIIWYWQEKVDEENAAAAAQQEAIMRAQAAAKQLLPGALQGDQAPPPKYDRKWEDAPYARDVLSACLDSLKKIPVAVTGWKLSSVRCNGNSVTLAWNRDSGMAAPPQGATVSDNASSASQSISLPPLKKRGSEDLSDPEVTTKRYLLQNWPGAINRIADDPLPPPPPNYTGPWNPPPAPWVKRSFTLTVPQLPGAVPDEIGNLQGAIINSMSFAPGGSWIIEGVIYENRK